MLEFYMQIEKLEFSNIVEPKFRKVNSKSKTLKGIKLLSKKPEH